MKNQKVVPEDTTKALNLSDEPLMLNRVNESY